MIAPAAVQQKDLVERARNLGPTLGKNIEAEENNGRLSPASVQALREAGFHKLYLPVSLGGLETDPLTTAKVVEEVSRHNTAAGWSLMVANTTLFMGGRFNDKAVETLFSNGANAFIAGTIHPPMRATQTKGGYIINGRNALVSNIHEATWLFATAMVMAGDQPKMNNGQPEIIGVVMDMQSCKIIDTWQTVGLRATDSNDAEATDVFVPEYLTFPLVPTFTPGPHFKGPLFRFPVAGANLACLLAPVTLAVARNAIEELKAVAAKKTPLGSVVTLNQRGVIQRKLGMAEALVQSARAYLHDSISQCWERVLAGKEILLEEKARLLLATAHANQSGVQAIELIYTAAGTTGIYSRNKLTHYYADAQVLRQHGFMNESRYETAAQVFLGLPPDLPVITF